MVRAAEELGVPPVRALPASKVPPVPLRVIDPVKLFWLPVPLSAHIVALVSESLPLHRTGSKFKALCPFHDDHNPSLELNPERQSYKCWSCGAGGDVFDFVQNYEHVEFPEALRMLADRAGEISAWKNKRVIVSCHHGVRSLNATAMLRKMGFSDAKSMAGGIEAWSVMVDEGVPRY